MFLVRLYVFFFSNIKYGRVCLDLFDHALNQTVLGWPRHFLSCFHYVPVFCLFMYLFSELYVTFRGKTGSNFAVQRMTEI